VGAHTRSPSRHPELHGKLAFHSLGGRWLAYDAGVAKRLTSPLVDNRPRESLLKCQYLHHAPGTSFRFVENRQSGSCGRHQRKRRSQRKTRRRRGPRHVVYHPAARRERSPQKRSENYHKAPSCFLSLAFAWLTCTFTLGCSPGSISKRANKLVVGTTDVTVDSNGKLFAAHSGCRPSASR
jgi:hypothetical protein